MSSNKFQPGLEVAPEFHEQPGLEVAPESGLHVHDVVEKTHDGANYHGYEQQSPLHQGVVPQNNGYFVVDSQGLYPRPSQEGTYVTDQSPTSLPPSGPTILGLKRKKFWWIFGPLISMLIMGLALGLGLGLGLSHDISNSNSGATSGSTPTTTSSSSTSSATAAPTPIACPQANGTTYEATGNEPFLVLCDVDYNGNAGGGTTDIGNEETSTVEDCINACAGNSSCAGAGWGNYNGTDTCWMKGSLGASNTATNWFFAIRQ
ncbi:hypothetical protein GGR53DRAFT_449811 [Hypoxylon sp. FL1150]|nr:hypothetical protein GGR53DRAFT_449811 [Hypoxylon sp. FL1150]